MALKITDECISCGACEPECENQAITEEETIYVIDPTKCTECVGISDVKKCVDICPVDCCIPDEDHVESHDELLEKWKQLHPGEEPKTN